MNKFVLTIHSNVNKTSVDVLKGDSHGAFLSMVETAKYMQTYLLKSQSITICEVETGEVMFKVVGIAIAEQ